MKRSLIVCFLLLLIIIPLGLKMVSRSQEVLAESIHSPLPVSTPTNTPTPTPTLSPTPTPAPPIHSASSGSSTPTPTPMPLPTADPNNNDVWEKLAACESHGNWTEDTGNSYFGGLQFNQGAWESVGGSGNPASASKGEQIQRGKMLQAQRGWSAWGGCSKELGLL